MGGGGGLTGERKEVRCFTTASMESCHGHVTTVTAPQGLLAHPSSQTAATKAAAGGGVVPFSDESYVSLRVPCG